MELGHTHLNQASSSQGTFLPPQKKSAEHQIPTLSSPPISSHRLLTATPSQNQEPITPALEILGISAATQQSLSSHEVSPLTVRTIISSYYENATSEDEKQACLLYLLQYQHYNAEYSLEENHFLKYPLPLFASQNKNGYVRSEYGQLLEIIKIWLEKKNPDLRKKILSNIKDIQANFLKLADISVIELLKKFYKDELTLIETSSTSLQGDQKTTVFIEEIEAHEITQEEAKKDLSLWLLKRLEEKLKSLPENSYFLFVLKHSNINCCLIWTGKFSVRKGKGNLNFIQFSEVFSLLNLPGSSDSIRLPPLLSSFGVVPDRLAVNHFVASQLTLEELDPTSHKKMSLPLISGDRWKAEINRVCELIKNNLDKDCFVYLEAILRWNFILEKYSLDVWIAPLFLSQVTPWIQQDSSIVEWAKGYQNLCEIILFAIQSFPNKFSKLDFRQSLETQLKSYLNTPPFSISVELYPYAMSATYHTLNAIFKSLAEEATTPPSIACLSQSYYETIHLIQMTSEIQGVTSSLYTKIEDLKEIPRILIADLHPNNATKSVLFTNHIASWIQEKFEFNHQAKMILVLDSTLNHILDADLVNLLEKVHPFILKGNLEVYGIQSLAKLAQLGADNLSGGACFYLGLKKFCGSPSLILPEKSTYFALLMRNFPDLTKKYVRRIRNNTHRVYQSLKRAFELEGFSSKVVLNVDEQSVYVVISFEKFLKELHIPAQDVDKIVSKLHSHFLSFSQGMKLPLTGRQSFGFSLTSLGAIRHAIRFSIGVEPSALLSTYVDVIVNFVYCLELYFQRRKMFFKIKTFIETSIAQLKSQSPTYSLLLSRMLEKIETKYSSFQSALHIPPQLSCIELKEGFKLLKKTIIQLSPTDPHFSTDLDKASQQFLSLCQELAGATSSFDESLERCRNFIEHTAKILITQKEEFSFEIPLVATNEPRSNKIGTLRIVYHHQEIHFFIDGCLIPKEQFQIESLSKTDWNHGILTRIFFQKLSLECSYWQCLKRNEESYELMNIFPNIFRVRHTKTITEKNFSIDIDPFALNIHGESFDEHQVTVQIEEMGKQAVYIDKLDDTFRHMVFNRLLSHHIDPIPSENGHGYHLKFGSRKAHLNYPEKINELWQQGQLPAVKDYLEEMSAQIDYHKYLKHYLQKVGEFLQGDLKYELLSPPYFINAGNTFHVPHNESCYIENPPIDFLHLALSTIATPLIREFNETHRAFIIAMPKSFKEALIHFMLAQLIQEDYKNTTICLSEKAAKSLSLLFEDYEGIPYLDSLNLLSYLQAKSFECPYFYLSTLENSLFHENNAHIKDYSQNPIRLDRFIQAIFPLLKRKSTLNNYGQYDVHWLICFKKFAQKLEHCQQLNDFFSQFEKELIKSASTGFLLFSLFLYLDYPFSEIQKEEFLKNIKIISSSVRKGFLNSFPKTLLNILPEIKEEEHVSRNFKYFAKARYKIEIQTFLQKTDCMKELLDLEMQTFEHLFIVYCWFLVTDDLSLKKLVFSFLETYSLTDEDVKQLTRISFLIDGLDKELQNLITAKDTAKRNSN